MRYVAIALITLFTVSCGRKESDKSLPGEHAETRQETERVPDAAIRQDAKRAFEAKIEAEMEIELAAIRKSFADYMQATTDGTGKQVAALVAADMVTFYRLVLQVVRTSEPSDDALANFIAQQIQESATDEEIERMTVETIFENYTGASSSRLELGAIIYGGDSAKAGMKVDGQNVGMIAFRKEDDRWKINLVPWTRSYFTKLGLLKPEEETE